MPRTVSTTSGSHRSLPECLQQIGRATIFRSRMMQEAFSSGMPDNLEVALLDAVRLFDELQIPYALIGGIAAMVYGRARFTDDVDFVAVSDHQHILASRPDVMQRYHFDTASTCKFYHASGIEIDIWKDEHTDQIAKRAVTVDLLRQRVRLAEVHDLIAMKLRASRFQDDYDISEILKSTAVDAETIRAYVTAAEFARFEQIVTRTKKL